MVKDNADLIGVINFFRAHFMERIKEIRCIDVVDHEKIRMGHNNIARFDFFHTGILRRIFSAKVKPLRRREASLMTGSSGAL